MVQKNNISIENKKLFVIYGSFKQWNNYILQEWYDILTTLVEDFGVVNYIADYGDKEWDTIENKMVTQYGRSPDVILFVECQDILNSLGHRGRSFRHTKLVTFNDDLHQKNKERVELKNSLLIADKQLMCYAYNFNFFYPELYLLKPIWIPHSFGKQFESIPFNNNPETKVLLSGACSEYYYPLRYLIQKKIERGDSRIEYLEHPGYAAIEGERTYAQKLNNYLICIGTGSKLHYSVAKIFEIPSIGSLLLLDTEMIPIMNQLGFIKDKHYVSFNKNNFDTVVDSLLDERNRLQVDQIRKQGYEFVRKFHSYKNRANTIITIFNSITTNNNSLFGVF